MKQTITKTKFIDAFERRGRDRQFSDAALEALFEFYTELENDTGKEMEYDPVAFCCDWTEYTLEELKAEFSECADAEDIDEAAEALEEVTTVIPVDGAETILVMAF